MERIWVGCEKRNFNEAQGESGKLFNDVGTKKTAWLRGCSAGGGELLTQTGDTVERWRERFEKLWNLTERCRGGRV